MSSEFYTDMADTAEELLTEFGGPVTLTQKTASVYDPATSSVLQAAQTHAGTGAKFDYSQRMLAESRVQAGDQRLLLSPYKTDGTALPAPTTESLVTVEGVTYTVVNVGVVKPATVVVLYDLQLRGVGA